MDSASPSRREWMTRSQVAEYLQVSTNTVDRWRHERGLPCHKRGNSVRFDRAEVDAWLVVDRRSQGVRQQEFTITASRRAGGATTGRENAARVICALLEADHPDYVWTYEIGPRDCDR